MALSLAVCSWHLPSLPAACFFLHLIGPSIRFVGRKGWNHPLLHSLSQSLIRVAASAFDADATGFLLSLALPISLLAFSSYLRTSSSFSLQCSCRILRVFSGIHQKWPPNLSDSFWLWSNNTDCYPRCRRFGRNFEIYRKSLADFLWELVPPLILLGFGTFLLR